jgi:CubicO group peptidase (beta-lactamase class C family)
MIGFLLAAPAVAAADPSTVDEIASRVEEYMGARVDRDKFSGSILVARDGKVLFCRGYGMANVEHDVSCTPKTKFRLGSITKQFTAMAILILQERGKLQVDDKVTKYLPSAPKAWDEITIRHLLTHTSGIPNYTGFPDFFKTMRNRATLAELIATFKDKPLDFKPGEKFKYSNSGYIVLGQVIESVSGQPYSTFLKQAIFDPLQMRDSGYDDAASILKNRASGYTRLLGIVVTNAQYIDMSLPHAAGALYSTVDDLLKWDQALYSEKLVPKKSLEAMFTPFKDGYGYGWNVAKKFDRARHAHAGGIPGFVTVIARFPAERLFVVVLSNLENAPVGTIGDDLAAIALDEPYVVPRKPKAIVLDSKFYDSYAGQYEADLPNAKEKPAITVTRDGNRLMIQPKGKPRVEAVPEAETRFYIKTIDGLAEFVKNPDGKVTHVMVLLNNEKLKYHRIDAPAKLPDARETTKVKPGVDPAKTAERRKIPAPDSKPCP